MHSWRSFSSALAAASCFIFFDLSFFESSSTVFERAIFFDTSLISLVLKFGVVLFRYRRSGARDAALVLLGQALNPLHLTLVEHLGTGILQHSLCVANIWLEGIPRPSWPGFSSFAVSYLSALTGTFASPQSDRRRLRTCHESTLSSAAQWPCWRAKSRALKVHCFSCSERHFLCLSSVRDVFFFASATRRVVTLTP